MAHPLPAATAVVGSPADNDVGFTTLISPGDAEAYADPEPAVDVVEAAHSVVAENYALPLPGEIIGGMYRVTEELSRGAMGVVFTAFDENLCRPVAIKVIRAELLRPGFVRRFLQEAQAMARVNHPHVVGIYALGEHRAAPYFVMERIEGVTLEKWLLQNPTAANLAANPAATSVGGAASDGRHNAEPDLSTRLKLLDEICLGVAAIHAAGAVHRDLKPSNILVDQELRCRVADFGLSILQENQDSAEVAGTLAYMAPELTLSFGERRPAQAVSDVYSLGCIAYELLTGKHPFRDLGRSFSGVHHVNSVVPPASALRSDLPRALDRVLQDALQRNPEQRTPTVEAFHRALKDAKAVAPDRILIAEDDDDFRELLRETLHFKFPGAEIECVSNGQAALAAVEARPASVALVDLQMPTLDGVTLTEMLRTRADTRSMPIIVLSGSGGAAEWKRLSSIGADRFLVKPVNLDDVVTMIEHTMRERKNANQ